MLFRYPQKHLTQNHIPILKIYDKPLAYSETFKFLGLHLDKCLSWNGHVHEVSNKISKACGTLSKLKHFLPSNVLLIIYNSLILPHLSYCITSWGFHNCHRLITLQKKAVRHISHSHWAAHSEPIFKNLNVLQLHDIFNISCLKVLYKSHRKLLPPYFNNFPALIDHPPRRCISRPHHLVDFNVNAPTLQPFIIQSTSHSKCVSHFIPKLVNDNYLPVNVLNKIKTHSFDTFIFSCKKYVIESYSENCTLLNCYVCAFLRHQYHAVLD